MVTPVGLPGAAGKTADKCQKDLKKAGLKLVTAQLKTFDKCASAAFKCIQTVADAAKRTECLSKAGTKCTTALAKITAAETGFRASFASKCAAGLTLTQLRDAGGLGFAATEGDCPNPIVVSGDLATCLIAQHACEAESLFSVQDPRAHELMSIAGVPPATLDQLDCLTPHGGTGLDLDDEKGAGKTTARCAQGLNKAGTAFVAAKLKSLQRCVDKVFTCVQTKPTDPKCVPKADSACDKEFLKIAAAEAKLRAGVAKSCGTLDFATVLGAADGADLADLDLDEECADYGAGPLTSLGAYTECLFRQHECRVDALIARQVPRAAEMLGMVGRTAGSAFCPIAN